MKQPLTNEQKKLVEQNHNLIYGFAKARNLLLDDYYGALAIGLCMAAQIYDKDKGNFSTVAYKCMENEVYRILNNAQKPSKIPQQNIFSYDAYMENESSDNPKCYLNVLTDNKDMCESVMNNMLLTDFLNNKLSEHDKVIISLYVDGMTHYEVAMQMGCTRQNISDRIKKIRKKLSLYLENIEK